MTILAIMYLIIGFAVIGAMCVASATRDAMRERDYRERCARRDASPK